MIQQYNTIFYFVLIERPLVAEMTSILKVLICDTNIYIK